MKRMAPTPCDGAGCSKKPEYGVSGSRKAEFCFHHATAGMVNVCSKQCCSRGCSKQPLYGASGSRKATFCSQHATAGMVHLYKQECGNNDCSKKASYGVSGSRKAEFCSQHATSGMVDVVNRKCANESCSKQPSYGISGSRKAEFCSPHATAGMVNVVNRKCANESCSKIPTYGVSCGRKAEFCSQHATAGMVDVVNRKCANKSRFKQALYRISSNRKAVFCSQHATAGMTNVKNNKGRTKRPSHGLAGSRTVELSPQHAREGMMEVANQNCDNEGYSDGSRHRVPVHDRDSCPPHTVDPTANNASNASGLAQERDDYRGGLIDSGIGSVLDNGRGGKRSYPDGSGSGSSGGVVSDRRVCASIRQGDMMQSPVLGKAVVVFQEVNARMKVELVDSPSIGADGGARGRSELVVPWIDWSSVGCSAGDRESAERLGSGTTTTPVVSAHPTAMGRVVSREAEAEANVKLELGVCSPHP